MPSASIVFSSITELFGLFAIGWLIRHRGYAEREDFDRWGKIAAAIFYPFLIFHSIIRDFDPARVRSLWILPSLAFGLMLLGALAGLLLRCGLKTRDPATRRTFVHLCAVNNFIFLPIFITLIRLILLPAIYIAIIQVLPLPGELRLLAIIVALMPTSSVSPVMSNLYGGVPAFASAAMLVTHLASLITVPLAFWWLGR